MKGKGFGKLAFWEFVIILLIGTFAYFKIGDGTIMIDYNKLCSPFGFNLLELFNKEETDENIKDNGNEDEKIAVSTIIEDEVLNYNEAYEKIRTLYSEALPFMYSTVPTKFTTGEVVDGYVEVLNYDEVMKSIFTENAIEKWEINNKDAIKKQDGKVYIMEADGVIGMDYVARSFIKLNVEKDFMDCKVDNMFYEKIWSLPEDFINPSILHIESNFKIVKENGIWLVDEINKVR